MFKFVSKRRAAKGFTLIELLLVISILGIITAVAVPVLLGQRQRAKMIGDAISNAETVRMSLEQRKADNGFYGPANEVYNYKADGTRPTPDKDIIRNFDPKGNSKMDYTITIGSSGVTYLLQVFDPTTSSSRPIVDATDNRKPDRYKNP